MDAGPRACVGCRVGAGEKVDRRGTLAGGYQDERKSQMKLHRSMADHSEGLAQKEQQRLEMKTKLDQTDTEITKWTSEVPFPRTSADTTYRLRVRSRCITDRRIGTAA